MNKNELKYTKKIRFYINMCEHYVNKFRPHIHFCPNQIIVDGYAMVLVLF